MFSKTTPIEPYVMAFVIVVSLAIRLFHITAPPLDFHPTRQYRSALLAREYYFRTATSVPEWRKNVAVLNKDMEGVMEPPIREILASQLYHLIGGEQLWILRLMSVMFWTIGGFFLYLIAKDTGSSKSALFSVIPYFFFPFGVSASRSMQPDAFMIMVSLMSIYAILRYYKKPSVFAFSIAIIISAAALLIKPVCLFLVFGTFTSVKLFKQGFYRTVTDRLLWLFFVLCSLPAFLYYFYGMFVATGVLSEIGKQAQGSFFPSLLLRSAYWYGWLYNVGRVVGNPAFIAALISVLILPAGLPKALLVGLWGGYFAFGTVFNYHVYTHDYYSLQLIPIVALSLGQLYYIITHYVSGHAHQKLSGYLFAAIFFIVAVCPGLREHWWRLTNPSYEITVKTARDISDIIGHSAKSIILTRYYGKELKYHGDLAGIYWPRSDDFTIDGELVKPSRSDVEKYFNTLCYKYSPDYFIVANFKEFEEQRDLKKFLTKRFLLIARTDNYLIFDLRARGKSGQAREFASTYLAARV